MAVRFRLTRSTRSRPWHDKPRPGRRLQADPVGGGAGPETSSSWAEALDPEPSPGQFDWDSSITDAAHRGHRGVPVIALCCARLDEGWPGWPHELG